MNPVSCEDQPIDADVARFAAAILDAGTRYPGLADRPLPERRAIAEVTRAPWRAGGPAMRRREETIARTGDIAVRVRILDAADAGGAPRPALIYVHGGGFMLFSLDTHDRLMREYAARADVAVIGVNYSLSPEARFPTALHEVIAAIDWVVREGAALGIDPARVAIGGDSAGANLALAACLALRDRGDGDRIAAMLFNYGFFDADFDTPSQRRHGGPGALLTTDELADYLDAYLGPQTARDDPRALPALAELHDLPASLHVIAACDPLADGDRALARRMASAGNRVERRDYAGATHSFLEAVSISALADRALGESGRWLAAALAPVGHDGETPR